MSKKFKSFFIVFFSFIFVSLIIYKLISSYEKNRVDIILNAHTAKPKLSEPEAIEKYGNKPIVNKNKITTFENNLTETPLKVISTPVNTVNKQNIYEED